MVEATTNRNGEYVLRASEFEAVGNWGSRQMGTFGTMKCVLRGSLQGWDSSMIDLDDPTLVGKRDLPPIVLRKRGSANLGVDVRIHAPRVSEKAWDRGMKAMTAGSLDEAERHFREAVRAAPDFAQAWNALGTVCQNKKKIAEAREAFRNGAKADPRTLVSQVLLMRLESSSRNWAEAAQAASEVIAKDPGHKFPEAHLHKALAKFYLQDLDAAAASAAEAIRLDPNHQLQNSEYISGLILEARREYPAAEEHYRKYLANEPKASNADAVRARLANLGKSGTSNVAMPELDAVDLNVRAVRGIGTPGGMKALSRMAHLDPQTPPSAFFEEYCRTLIRSTDPTSSERFPRYIETLRIFFESMLALSSAGELREHATAISISIAGEDRKAQAARVLQALGWRIKDSPGASSIVELADGPADGPRQLIAAALDIDEIAMKETLEAGRPFEFVIPIEEAPLMGGDAWLQMIHDRQMLPGGLAEAFARDARLARAYAGLSAASTEAAAALVAGLGLRTLVEQHSDLLLRTGAAFSVRNGSAVIPGGPAAAGSWKLLAGAGPDDPQGFFTALLSRDHGKLAAFFAALTRSDRAHQAYFTQTAKRLEHFYHAYSDPAEKVDPRRPRERSLGDWTDATLQGLPLGPDGVVHFPGGRALWGNADLADEDILTSSGSASRLLALAELERKRGVPFSPPAVVLLRRHFDAWQPLFPYFARLKAVDQAELGALEKFGEQMTALTPPQANNAQGIWYSLVELSAMGADSGSLSQSAAALAFQNSCEVVRQRDWIDAALEIVKHLAGDSPDLDEGIRSCLLRLNGTKLEAFERVIQLQNVPRVQQAAKTRDVTGLLHALTGIVYAARLDPHGLLLSEDRHLVTKHSFAAGGAARGGPLFRPVALERSNKAPGSRLTGGFMNLEEVSHQLVHGGQAVTGSVPERTLEPIAGHSGSSGGPQPGGDVFRSDVRLVEVYTTITDAAGKYVDDLPESEFTLLEDGKPQQITAFESRLAALSCSLLLDTTFSMQAALPVLKNAAFGLIDQLRPSDSVGVYTFSDKVSALQPFTRDRLAAKRAIARTQPRGETALYDALTRVIRDTASQQGKKVIVIFTDGDDNFSSLSVEDAIRRAKSAGIPVYTIAQGMALGNPALLKQLAAISNATGGLPFAIREPREIRQVFEMVAKDLAHGYLLTFPPGPAPAPQWRKLAVQVKNSRGYKVRAREGYFPE